MMTSARDERANKPFRTFKVRCSASFRVTEAYPQKKVDLSARYHRERGIFFDGQQRQRETSSTSTVGQVSSPNYRSTFPYTRTQTKSTNKYYSQNQNLQLNANKKSQTFLTTASCCIVLPLYSPYKAWAWPLAASSTVRVEAFRCQRSTSFEPHRKYTART